MTNRATNSFTRQALIDTLAEPARINTLTARGARFLYALRLIALHHRAGRDPVPELAVRMGSVDVAAKALALSQAISWCWPEHVHVSRFCCEFMTHDEWTIGAMIDGASRCNRNAFEEALEGLIRPDRMQRMWDPVLSFVAAESNAALPS